MASSSYVRMARSLAGAVVAVPLCTTLQGARLQCEEKPKKPPFLTAKCTKNEVHTANTRLISLSLPGAWKPQGPVVNVLVRAKIEAPASSTVARPYNPLCAESGNSITLLVKRYEDSKMGAKLHSLKVGETVEVLGPKQQYAIEAGKYSHYGMVAGGTGITPLIQAAEYILSNGTAKVTMVTFNKTSQDVLLRKKLAHFEVKYPDRFKVVHVVESNGAVSDLEGSAASEELLKTLLPPPGPGVLVMVCGRKEMTEAVAGPKTPDFKQGEVGGVLKKLGYWSQQVWKL